MPFINSTSFTIHIQNLCAVKKITCRGNYPRDKEAKKIYLTSGFNNYVRSKIKSHTHSNKKMQIKSGLKTEPAIARQCCIFTHKTRVQTKSLYKTFIELMSNAFHHAYDSKVWIKKKWYIYAENEDDRIRFIFVDTGHGIAKTVRKNFPEKLQQLFGDITALNLNDAQLIQSAFNGDFRTSTKQENRGNGLVTIKDCILNNAAELQSFLGYPDWLNFIGVSEADGRPCIYIYVNKKKVPRSEIPELWEGIPVKVRYIGKIRPT